MEMKIILFQSPINRGSFFPYIKAGTEIDADTVSIPYKSGLLFPPLPSFSFGAQS